ncbi:M15 family metallopeptidase [Pseudoclavibacter helvolus]|uniref:M15 family metallopeptidase n=1 Tax=Pseudoclavibacter helvolus TaxID=255205 RepID=UPI003735D286
MIAHDIGFPNGDPRNAQGVAFGYRFRPEAAGAFLALAAEYRAAWGADPPIVEAMRSLEEQLRLYNGWATGKPGFNLAAPPIWTGSRWVGTSLHGLGLSVDLGWPLNNSLTEQHAWFVANAPRFGWVWTGRTFSQVEAWHFDYTGVNVTAAQRAAYIEAGLRGSLTSPAAAVLLT